MKFSRYQIHRSTILAALTVLGLGLLLLGCSPEDYQKPIQGFQSASDTVIAADRAFLDNENNVEQDLYIDQQVFGREKFGPADVDKKVIISDEEIKFRTEALDALAQYTASLASLAQGKAQASSGQDMKASSDKLKASATKAGSKATPDKSPAAFNTKFSGLATAAAAAIGAVAQLIVEHRAETEIKKSVQITDKDVTVLIGLIYDDAQGSYLRQQSQSGIYGVQLYKDYECEISDSGRSSSDGGAVDCSRRAGEHADPIALLSLADRLKAYRRSQATLENANPAPAIQKMQKSHEALVAYVTSNKNPEKLSDLIKEVKDFVSAAQPLGDAVQHLLSSTK